MKIDTAAVHAHRDVDSYVSRIERQPFSVQWLEDNLTTKTAAVDGAACKVLTTATRATSEKVQDCTSNSGRVAVAEASMPRPGLRGLSPSHTAAIAAITSA